MLADHSSSLLHSCRRSRVAGILAEEDAERGRHANDGTPLRDRLASLARSEEGNFEDVMTVYHLLWVPDQTAATLGVPETDPGDGRPFLRTHENSNHEDERSTPQERLRLQGSLKAI